MEKVKNYSLLMAACIAILLVSCKNDTKNTASTEATNTTVAQTTPIDAQAVADSIAKVEAAALAMAKEDSIAKAAAASEMAAKEKNTKATTKPSVNSKTQTTTALPSKKPKPAVPMPTTKNGNVKKRTGKDDVFVISEVKPSYPGGDAEMMKYLKKNIQYPLKAKENGIKGTVFMSFVVEKDGSVTDVEVVKGINPLLDAEAKRVVASMPNWSAGKQNGKSVAVQYTLPVKFELIQ